MFISIVMFAPICCFECFFSRFVVRLLCYCVCIVLLCLHFWCFVFMCIYTCCVCSFPFFVFGVLFSRVFVVLFVCVSSLFVCCCCFDLCFVLLCVYRFPFIVCLFCVSCLLLVCLHVVYFHCYARIHLLFVRVVTLSSPCLCFLFLFGVCLYALSVCF